MKILIADSGSTKTSWCIAEQKKKIVEIETEGINPLYLRENLSDVVAPVKRIVAEQGVQRAVFFGAGCVDERVNGALEQALCDEFCIPFHVQSDIVGAAVAALGGESGIVSILGTGANCAYYDGKTIVSRVPAGGFILGDEGSGAVIGRRVISDYIKGVLPDEMSRALSERYRLDYSSIVERVYRGQQPSRWLAEFSAFLYDFRTTEYAQALLHSEFERFYERNIRQLCAPADAPLAFVGSIAHFYRDELSDVLRLKCRSIYRVVRRPIDGLVEFYS